MSLTVGLDSGTIPAAVSADHAHPPATRARVLTPQVADLLSRLAIGSLFSILAIRIGANFLQTGRFTGLLLLISELLVVVLKVFRRPAKTVDRSMRARGFTAFSILGPPLLQPITGVGLLPDLITAPVSALGLLVVIAGKMALGRSFGLMPAHRGIVCSGAYRFVRHPIYFGYLVTHLAFLVAHPTFWNITIRAVADTALLVRAAIEERTLAKDPEYAAYQTRVRWRVVPGLY